MSYSETDFCKADFGVKYIFAKMSIIYGSVFRNHFGDTDRQSVIDTWADILGVYSTYRPSMDFSLNNMDAKFIPSALAFRDLCRQGPRIPSKPHTLITKQPTQAEVAMTAKAKNEALDLIAKFTNKVVK